MYMLFSFPSARAAPEGGGALGGKTRQKSFDALHVKVRRVRRVDETEIV